jgi:Flp pilus assembly protein TadD
VADGSAYARRGRFLSGVSLIALKQYDEAFTVFKTLQDAAPDPAILNNLGVIQLRRQASPDSGKPTYYFTKAAEAEPDDPDLLFNLGYAYAVDKDPQGAIYWLREALRRNPADGDAHTVLAFALDAAGSTVEATRERELAAQLSPRASENKREPLPRGLERERHDLEAIRGQGIDQAIATTTQRDQRELAQFHLERGRRLFEAEQDREAMTELRRAVFLSPYEADAHLLIGRIHLRAGRPREAIDALKISIWSRDTAAAQVALGDAYLRLKDAAEARAHAQKALALDPASAEAKALLERIDKGG